MLRNDKLHQRVASRPAVQSFAGNVILLRLRVRVSS
jgi:hypothetical protein